ncbi:hypothetical protein AgCh_025025 [Apium graveolens]
MDALKHNDTWELTTLPAGRKVVWCRWVFTVKQKPNGLIERYKSRLVAKGYTQTYRIDYQETFAPVAKIASIRVLVSYATNLGWELQQLDVKNTFLHGNLKDESPRVWFGKFQRVVVRFGYKQGNSVHTMFVKRKSEKITVLIVYVDDIVITDNDTCEIVDVKRRLASEFEMKDLGKLRLLPTELGLASTTPMKLHCDNKSAIAIGHDPVQHDRTKHIEIDRHFIKEKIYNDTISIHFMRSEDQVADVLTKGSEICRVLLREEPEVKFPRISEKSSLPGNYDEIENSLRSKKWNLERLLEDMRKEQSMLDQAKFMFEIKKQEFVRFLAQSSHHAPASLPL